MELAGIALRWLQLGAGLALIGSACLLLLAGPCRASAAVRWRHSVLAAARWLVVVLMLAGVGLLMLQTASVTGRAESALSWAEVSRLLENTRYGSVWLMRQGMALSLLLWLTGQRRLVTWCGEPLFDALLLAAAAAQAAAGVLTGHGAATEPVWLATIGHLTHLMAAGVWAGGLPALAYGLRLAAHRDDTAARAHFAAALRRFSALAAASVLLLMVSGSVIGYLQLGAPTQWPGQTDGLLYGLFTLLERTAAPLLATDYGLLVVAKVALLVPILAVAARVRFVCMPRLGDIAFDQRTVLAGASHLVRLEIAVVLAILLAAAALGTTLPAAHDRLVWPFPFRFSVSATWDTPDVPWRVVGGTVLVVTGAFTGRAARQRLRRGGHVAPALGVVGLATLAVAAGLALGLQALAVKAYPDTYRRTDSAYTAVSVARGAELFGRYCMACHGTNGMGNGPAAAGLPRPPADLSKPHTALHTAGDMFWWLTHGMPEGRMPGFELQMSTDDRWDTVNFLRAFSAGFQARILTTAVVPGKPWLGPPDFDFSTTTGSPATLKDYRDRQTVRLVFYSWPGSRALGLTNWRSRTRHCEAATPRSWPSPCPAPLVHRRPDCRIQQSATAHSRPPWPTSCFGAPWPIPDAVCSVSNRRTWSF